MGDSPGVRQRKPKAEEKGKEKQEMVAEGGAAEARNPAKTENGGGSPSVFFLLVKIILYVVVPTLLDREREDLTRLFCSSLLELEDCWDWEFSSPWFICESPCPSFHEMRILV